MASMTMEPPSRLELVDIAIHAAGGGRAEGAGGHAGRGLGGAGIIDRMVLEIVGHRLSRFQPLTDLGMGKVARDDDGPGEREPRLHRMLRQRFQNVAIGRLRSICDHIAAAQMGGVDLRHEAGGIVSPAPR